MPTTDGWASGANALTRSAWPWLAALAVIQYALFFRSGDHFFQADTIYWLYYRYTSMAEFLAGFLQLDPSGWYRPLAGRTISSLLFPYFEFQPSPYRLALFPLLVCNTAAAFFLIKRLTRSFVPTVVATIWYATHSVSAYVTYDAAFAPELLYSLFGLGSALFFVRHFQCTGRRDLWISLILFAAALCSKESAVMLPFLLMAIYVLCLRKSERMVPNRAAASFLPASACAFAPLRFHFAALALYFIYVVGYLQVAGIDLTSLFTRTEGSASRYSLVLDAGLLTNARDAAAWAFNIPAGWYAETAGLDGWMVAALHVFCALVLLLAATLLLTPARKLIVFGWLWFFVSLGPVLLLGEHFLKYYVFFPMVGTSMIVGLAVEQGHRQLSRLSGPIARVTLISGLGALTMIIAIGAENERRRHRLLGESSAFALSAIDQLRALYPVLKPGTQLLFVDYEQPTLSWDHASGALFRMAYFEEDIHAAYATREGLLIADEHVESIIVLAHERGRLRDVTQQFLTNREDPAFFRIEPEIRIELSHSEVIVGKDAYTLTIRAMAGSVVRFLYRLNDGPTESFDAKLNHLGQVTFVVGSQTTRGTYQFVGFAEAKSGSWIRTDARVVAR